MRGVRGRRAGDARTYAFGQYFRPGSRMDPNSACGRGRGGVARGPGATSIFSVAGPATSSLQRDGAICIAGCRFPATAALGGEFEVPAIDGSKARVKVPCGTQTGAAVSADARACRCSARNKPATCMSRSRSKTPQNLTKRQRE